MPRNVVAIIRMLFVEFVLELCLRFLHISRHQKLLSQEGGSEPPMYVLLASGVRRIIGSRYVLCDHEPLFRVAVGCRDIA